MKRLLLTIALLLGLTAPAFGQSLHRQDTDRAGTETGNFILCVRNSAGIDFTNADNRFSAVSCNNKGELSTAATVDLGGAFGTTAAAADDTTNPTAGQIRAFLFAKEGTTWDQLTSTSGRLNVQIGGCSGGACITTDTMDDSATRQQSGAGLTITRLYTDNGTNLVPVVVCDKSVPISTATSGNVQLVALSGSTLVHVCAFSVTSVADVSIQFVSGTGSACGTGETDRTGLYQLNGSGVRGVSQGTGVGRLFGGAAGEALCIELSTTVQVDGFLSYAQY